MSEKQRRSYYSGLSAHRECPQKWSYRNLQGLRKLTQGESNGALDFGTWWHMVRAAYAIDQNRSQMKYVPKKLRGGNDAELLTDRENVLDGAFGLMDECWRGLTTEAQDGWVEVYGKTLTERMGELNDQWLEVHAKENADEVVLGVEVWWERDLPPSPIYPNLDPIPMGGFIDAVVLNKRRNVLIVRDYKTTGLSLTQPSSLDDMMDSQLQLYPWGATPLMKEWGLPGFQAISYDRIRSSAPKEPKITASGGLSATVKDFNKWSYKAWCGEGVPWGAEGEYVKTGKNAGKPKFGVYTFDQELYDHLSTPEELSKWFTRTRVPVNLRLVRAHLQAAIDTHHDTTQTIARVESTGQAARNFGWGCRRCDFAELCRAELFGGPVEEDADMAQYGLMRREER